MSLLRILLKSLGSPSAARPRGSAEPIHTPIFRNDHSASWKPGRTEERSDLHFEVWLSGGQEPMFAELAFGENVSSGGVRVRTELSWKPGTRLFVKPSTGKVWTRARVVYCERVQEKNRALGLEFYRTSHRYTLTFRCIHCGKYEASANFRSDQSEPSNQLKARIYRIQCARCGWKGEACGLSAVRILRYQSKEASGFEGTTLLVRSPAGAKRSGPVKRLSLV